MINKRNVFGVSLGFTLLLLIYGAWIEPNLVEVRHLWIQDTKIKKVLKNKIAVHISDLHIDKIGKREEKVLKMIDELKPDLIFLTGDYVKWYGDYKPALIFLSRLKAKIGVWAVMGDYDYSCSRKSCLFCHSPDRTKPTNRHNVRFLRNSFERISLPDGYLIIMGIDEGFEQPFDSSEILQFLSKDESNIILSHNPLAFDSLDYYQDVIMLAGDTHGGQIPLPSWLWQLLGYEKNSRYNQGLFREGRKKMYVTRGIGTSHTPIRILRRPELVVLNF